MGFVYSMKYFGNYVIGLLNEMRLLFLNIYNGER